MYIPGPLYPTSKGANGAQENVIFILLESWERVQYSVRLSARATEVRSTMLCSITILVDSFFMPPMDNTCMDVLPFVGYRYRHRSTVHEFWWMTPCGLRL